MFAFASLLALAVARPDHAAKSAGGAEVVPIIRSDVVGPGADGEYSFDFETEDGIVRSESGAGSGPDGAVESQGTISFTHPDGTPFELKFVADVNGYHPESDALPVAPAFPHPIPQHAIDQIAFAAEEDANRPLDAARGDYVGDE